MNLDLEYVQEARIVASSLHDFINKTLVIEFKKPQRVVSTLDGARDGIRVIGNHGWPPPTWHLNHTVEAMRVRLYPLLQVEGEEAAFLFTGASMDNLAVQREQYRDMVVYGLVTAGVRGNAVRMAKDIGRYYEPGTINVVLLTNMHLSDRAMHRAMVSATEGKTAALADLDIRSTYTPLAHQATGTGTDNILIAEGQGFPIETTGGHTKMGELIAKAVYKGVQAAIAQQNGIVAGRNPVLQLAERRLNLFSLFASGKCGTASSLAPEIENLLLEERYAGLLRAALAASDREGADFSSFSLWGTSVAGEISGQRVTQLTDCLAGGELPLPLSYVLNGLANGVVLRHGPLKLENN